MKMEYIREYLVLSDTRNYSKAASELYISQPTLSRHIQALEDDLGCQLVVTSSHGISFTDLGEKAIRSFRKIIKEYDRFLEQCQNDTQHISGTLRLGLLYYAIDDYMADFITYFQSKYENVNLICESGLPQRLFDLLDNGILDIASMFYLNDKISNDFICYRITTQSLIAILSETNPLHVKNCVTLEELSEYPLVELKQDTYSTELTHAILVANNVHFRQFCPTDNLEMVPLAVRSSNGIHITGESCRKQNASSVVYVPIEIKKPTLSFGFAALKGNSNPLTTLFWKEAEAYYSQNRL